MNRALEILQSYLTGGLQRAPGWAPLLALCHGMIVGPGGGGGLAVRGLGLPLPGLTAALWAVAITAVLYKIGDLWDDAAFGTLRR